MKRSHAIVGLCAPAVFIAAAPTFAQYEPGFLWSRTADWVDGTTANDTTNNPGPDLNGNPVWSYEATRGGGFDSADPWYAQPADRLVWDDDWWGIGTGAWALGDDLNPPVFHNRLTHNLSENVAGTIPLVRWMNPAGDGVEVALNGGLTVKWSGTGFIGSETDVDVVIALADASEGSIVPLLSETLSKPTAGDSAGDSVLLPVQFDSLFLDAGDSLVISHRGHEVFAEAGRWIPMLDGLDITVVPAPGSLALISLAGLVSVRRRR